MIRYIGIILFLIGFILFLFTLISGKRNKIKNIKKEYDLITETGYANVHSANGIRDNIYHDEPIKAAPRPRSVSKEAETLLEAVERERFEEEKRRRGLVEKEKTNNKLLNELEESTGILENQGGSTEVLEDVDDSLNETMYLDQGETGILPGLQDNDTDVLNDITDSLAEEMVDESTGLLESEEDLDV